MRTTIPGHEASSERNGKGAGLKKESRQRCRIQEKWIPEGVYMGMYLNSFSPYTLYKNETCSPYFVDKSMLLEELFPLAELGNRHICITRPRRFGKTVMANMVGAFFGKGADAGEVFDRLKISESKDYRKYNGCGRKIQ